MPKTAPTLIRLTKETKSWLVRKAGGPRKLGRFLELCAAKDRTTKKRK